jgi:hypothetical protein
MWRLVFHSRVGHYLNRANLCAAGWLGGLFPIKQELKTNLNIINCYNLKQATRGFWDHCRCKQPDADNILQRPCKPFGYAHEISSTSAD